jgi:hypothetical protein
MTMTDPIADFLTRRKKNILRISFLLMMASFKLLEFFLNMILTVAPLSKISKGAVGRGSVSM